MPKSVSPVSLSRLGDVLAKELEGLYRLDYFMPMEEALLRGVHADFWCHFVVGYRLHRMRKRVYTAEWIGQLVQLSPSKSRLGSRSLPPGISFGLSDTTPERACPACAGSGCALDSFDKPIAGFPPIATGTVKSLADSLRSLMDQGKLDHLLAELREALEDFASRPIYTYQITFWSQHEVPDGESRTRRSRWVRCFLSSIALPVPTGATSRLAHGLEPLMTPGVGCQVCWGTGAATTG